MSVLNIDSVCDLCISFRPPPLDNLTFPVQSEKVYFSPCLQNICPSTESIEQK